MIAKTKNLVAHIGRVSVEISRVGAVTGVGLEKFVPKQNAVFIAEIVEISTGALSDPVADDGVVESEKT